MATCFLAFLQNLDADLRKALQERFRVLWTHHSTAIEGNILTLSETAFVLGEGLTVAGKPLKDHQEVVGHARAIDLLDDWLTNGKPVTERELFQLHRVVQTSVVMDICQPVGAWKVEPNGAQVVVGSELVFNDTYAYPEDVPALMVDWLQALAKYRDGGFTPEQALAAYVDLHASFVRMRWTPEFGQGCKLCSTDHHEWTMSKKRKQYSSEFKAKVALAALSGEEAAGYVPPGCGWKPARFSWGTRMRISRPTIRLQISKSY